jgi:hypothetical protein
MLGFASIDRGVFCTAFELRMRYEFLCFTTGEYAMTFPTRCPVYMRFGLSLIFLLCGLCTAGSTSATTFCVASETALRSALVTAANDMHDDEIDLVAGNYALTNPLIYNATYPYALSLIGGWNATCTAHVAGTTTLDGGGTKILVEIVWQGNLSVEQIRFYSAVGGAFLASDLGDVRVDRNSFIFIHAQAGSPSALSLDVAQGHAWIRGNLFQNNTTDTAAAANVHSNGGEVYVSNNTFYSNQTNITGGASALALSGSAHVTLSNNILWGNTGFGGLDLFSTAANLRYHNDIGVWGGAVADAGSSGELNIDPHFRLCGATCDPHLGTGSPLVNTGLDAAPGGVTVFDLDGLPRILGTHIDIGAYEQDVIFANGFQ